MAMVGSLLSFLILLSELAFAGSVTGSLDKNSGTTEDTFQYVLSIQGRLTDQPQFPNVPGLSVLESQQSSSTSIINGRRSSELNLIYVLRAENAGEFTIPPISLMIDGRIEKTNPVRLKVRAMTEAERKKRPLYLEQSLSKTSFYQGESVLLTLRLHSRYQLHQIPDFATQFPSGIRSQKIGEPVSEVRTIDGVQFQVVEQKFLLLVDSSSVDRIPPSFTDAYLSTGRRSFFSSGVQKKRVQSNSLSLDIKPLPSEGRSKDFSGLVGDFDMNLEILKRDVQRGDNVSLSIVLFGNGESKTMKEPQLSLKSPENFKIYKDKPIENLNLKDGKEIVSEKVFNVALVPQVAGELNLGRVSVEYFSTKTKRYEILEKDLGVLRVKDNPALAQSQLSSPQQSPIAPPMQDKQVVSVLGTDILGLHGEDRLGANHSLSQGRFALGILVILFSLSLAPLAKLYHFYKDPSDLKLVKMRRGKAYKTFLKKKNEIKSEVHDRGDDFAILVQESFKSYLGDKLGINPSTITEKDVQSLLSRKKLSQSIIDEAVRLYQDLDLFRYSKRKGTQDNLDLLDRTGDMVKNLEGLC